MHTSIQAVSKNTYMMSPHALVLTKPIYKCNEDRPCYATQYEDIFLQYKEGFILSPKNRPPTLITHTHHSPGLTSLCNTLHKGKCPRWICYSTRVTTLPQIRNI